MGVKQPTPPEMPERNKHMYYSYAIDKNTNLKKVVDYFSQKTTDLSKVTYERSLLGPGAGFYVYAQETEEDYNKRVEQYKSNLIKYNKDITKRRENFIIIKERRRRLPGK